MKQVLFACYGSGHVRMVLPVARALQASGRAQVKILGLTTAAPVVRDAGLPLLQFKDFVEPSDAAALEQGRRLAAGLDHVQDEAESAAYLGLGYAELAAEVGEAEAQRRYARNGRQAFLPRATLRRILERVRPDLVFATNAPRGERAAILAARDLGIPSVCLVDLFAVDEVRWIGEPGYADRVLVLNEHVRRFLTEAGRRPEEVVVTGNPAFDVLADPEVAAQGRALRTARGWDRRRVVLWPWQDEPAVHPFDGRAGDPTLPHRVQQALVDWAQAQADVVLCVRPRPGQAMNLPQSGSVVMTGQDWPLAPLLHATDLVVTLTSTVGLEGYLCGARLVQVRGSVFDEAMPLARFGIADAAVDLPSLPAALDHWSRAGRRPAQAGQGAATARVLEALDAFL